MLLSSALRVVLIRVHRVQPARAGLHGKLAGSMPQGMSVSNQFIINMKRRWKKLGIQAQ
jgi:hypothetical protein